MRSLPLQVTPPMIQYHLSQPPFQGPWNFARQFSNNRIRSWEMWRANRNTDWKRSEEVPHDGFVARFLAAYQDFGLQWRRQLAFFYWATELTRSIVPLVLCWLALLSQGPSRTRKWMHRNCLSMSLTVEKDWWETICLCTGALPIQLLKEWRQVEMNQEKWSILLVAVCSAWDSLALELGVGRLLMLYPIALKRSETLMKRGIVQ